MRVLILVTLGAITLAACQKKDQGGEASRRAAAAPSASKPAAGPPRLKAVLWTQKISAQGMDQEIRLCLDEASAAKMNLWGSQTSSDLCAQNVVTPVAGGWRF